MRKVHQVFVLNLEGLDLARIYLIMNPPPLVYMAFKKEAEERSGYFSLPTLPTGMSYGYGPPATGLALGA